MPSGLAAQELMLVMTEPEKFRNQRHSHIRTHTHKCAYTHAHAHDTYKSNVAHMHTASCGQPASFRRFFSRPLAAQELMLAKKGPEKICNQRIQQNKLSGNARTHIHARIHTRTTHYGQPASFGRPDSRLAGHQGPTPARLAAQELVLVMKGPEKIRNQRSRQHTYTHIMGISCKLLLLVMPKFAFSDQAKMQKFAIRDPGNTRTHTHMRIHTLTTHTDFKWHTYTLHAHCGHPYNLAGRRTHQKQWALPSTQNDAFSDNAKIYQQTSWKHTHTHTCVDWR